jgi:hypothetical protein
MSALVRKSSSLMVYSTRESKTILILHEAGIELRSLSSKPTRDRGLPPFAAIMIASGIAFSILNAA